jgi:transcriptional regulator with XRE-family HTH domain
MDAETKLHAVADADVWVVRLNKTWALTGWPKTELARRAGVPKGSVYKYLANKVKQPRGNILDRLADALGVSRLWLREGLGSQFNRLPCTGHVSVGENVVIADDPLLIASYGEIDFDLGTRDPVVVEVRGSSMVPAYRPGDHIICARARGADIEGHIGHDCVVRTEGGEAYIKLLTRGGRYGTFTLESYNRAYPAIRNARLQWAARVLWVRRQHLAVALAVCCLLPGGPCV